MNIPITDKFLWDLCNFIETIRLPRAPKTIYEATSPDLLSFRRAWEKKNRQKYFSQLIYYLKKRGLIRINNLQSRKAIAITPMGLEKISEIKYENSKKDKRRDGKWQMITFDVPEKKRRLRDLLRSNLIFLGYRMLQKSIWVCPFDVKSETEKFLREYSLDPYVKIFLIEETEI
ncbi:MAG: CRISPR-associated endonuclease Cas2 [bacterium]|nr:CRISPR-associated endonuclease Cas2 [bacterium]